MPQSFALDTIRRSDQYAVNPDELIIDQADRGRYLPPSEEQVMALAVSIMENTQQQAAKCRRVEGNKLRLTMGFTRCEAVKLIRKGFEYQGKTYHDPSLLLGITVDKGLNEERAFIGNIIENAHRNQTSPIDDAHNQRKLRLSYGYSDDSIASLYGCSVAQVQRLEKLLCLSEYHQGLVHAGELSILAALDLLQLDEESRTEVVAAVKAAGKATGTEIRNAVRSTAAKKGIATTKNLARTAKDIRVFFDKVAETHEGPVAEFAETLASFVTGELTDEAMLERFEAFAALAFPNDFKLAGKVPATV